MKKIHWFTHATAPNNLIKGDFFDITERELVKQIFKVLKLQKGELVVIKSDHLGYECEISEVSRDKVTLLILEKKQSVTQKKISLVFCIPKKDKFELILEKCTEIGITDFYPVISDRTIKTNINIERASKIIQEASEQAQRLDTPVLHTITNLDDIFDELTPIVFDTEGTKVTSSELKEKNTFLIGPEGGFSERELDLFKEKGLEIYRIGETVLKTETAAIVMSGILLN
ncbi:MAG: ribosomal small subunit methyltransferase [Candidatus Parcubacteria bacterium]|jgi:16S rRNA (uracil1498-N3)-methyltransferase